MAADSTPVPTGAKWALWIMAFFILSLIVYGAIVTWKLVKANKANKAMKALVPGAGAAPGSAGGATTTSTPTTLGTPTGPITIPAGVELVETQAGGKYIKIN